VYDGLNELSDDMEILVCLVLERTGGDRDGLYGLDRPELLVHCAGDLDGE